MPPPDDKETPDDREAVVDVEEETEAFDGNMLLGVDFLSSRASITGRVRQQINEHIDRLAGSIFGMDLVPSSMVPTDRILIRSAGQERRLSDDLGEIERRLLAIYGVDTIQAAADAANTLALNTQDLTNVFIDVGEIFGQDSSASSESITLPGPVNFNEGERRAIAMAIGRFIGGSNSRHFRELQFDREVGEANVLVTITYSIPARDFGSEPFSNFGDYCARELDREANATEVCERVYEFLKSMDGVIDTMRDDPEVNERIIMPLQAIVNSADKATDKDMLAINQAVNGLSGDERKNVRKVGKRTVHIRKKPGPHSKK
jgi:hypothetical protein